MKTNNKTMSNKLDQIREVLGLSKKAETFAETKLVDGTVIGTDAEKFEDGVLVYITGDDGEKMPLPSGEYELQDGTMINVVDGELRSRKEPEGADETMEREETEDKVVKEEEMSSEVDLSAYALKSELTESLELMMAKIEELEAHLTGVDAISTELANLKKLSADKPFKHNMSASQQVSERKAIAELTSQERIYRIFNEKKNK
tara:strand:+ start:3795 stop:4403 length:609 start_codon:yes stop_codon:yes gene_type:complete